MNCHSTLDLGYYIINIEEHFYSSCNFLQGVILPNYADDIFVSKTIFLIVCLCVVLKRKKRFGKGEPTDGSAIISACFRKAD